MTSSVPESSASAPSPLPPWLPRAPDLVRDTLLDTTFVGDHTVHLYDDDDEGDGSETTPPADIEDERFDAASCHRGSQRTEYWEWECLLGGGGCADVWLQKCVKGARAGRELRAVKVIGTGQNGAAVGGWRARQGRAWDAGSKVDYMPELEAIAKFSQKRVRLPFSVSSAAILPLKRRSE